MNYKQLFPTYRNRFLFLERALKSYGNKAALKAANFGCGEGELDEGFLDYCEHLTCLDINPSDIEFAAQNNPDTKRIEYKSTNILDTKFEPNHFDLIISTEVLEHVGSPEKALAEIHRVLKKGGNAILTFPVETFPFSYDPINFIQQRRKGRLFNIGAYAFGHSYLIDLEDFKLWANEIGFEVNESVGLSFGLIGLLEMYWTGLVQSMFKNNSKNLNVEVNSKIALRPSRSVPWLVFITDLIIYLDKLFSFKKRAIGRGVVLTKK